MPVAKAQGDRVIGGTVNGTGAFRFRALRRGRALIALQPERGEVAARDGEYHDLSRTPRHAYVAFYLWLRAQGLHALVHIGAHGTLIFFVHPKDMNGVLTEIMETPREDAHWSN